MGLRAGDLVGKVLQLVPLARVEHARHAVGVLQLGRERGRGVARVVRGGSSSAVDIDEVRRWWMWSSLLLCVLCVIVITPSAAGVGLKGFAGAEGRVGRG